MASAFEAAGAFAAAKVNLFLHVGAPDAEGFHPLCSLMAFADVGDRLAAAPAEAMSLEVVGPFAQGLSAGADNLVWRAAELMAAQMGTRRKPVRLVLDKQLPVASGLGGGSADAGAALRLLSALWGPLQDEQLEALARRTGSDGPACLWGRPTLAQGRGEILSPAPRLPPLHAVLVNAGAPVSTPQVYGELDRGGAVGEVIPPPMPADLESAQEAAAWLAGLRNDLEKPAVAVEPMIGHVLETLRGERETLLARVSGSGGTCFALCAGDIEAETLAQRVLAMRPGWWVRPCRLGGPWA